jgi:glycosyltransferase involved in cell wall biosynthesis
VTLSIVVITYNEESNLGRTLASVQPLVADGQGEIIVVDSGSTDRTLEIAKSHGAKVFVETWKGYAGQKNSAIEKASGEWILSLDGDEEVEHKLADEIRAVVRLREVLKPLPPGVEETPTRLREVQEAMELLKTLYANRLRIPFGSGIGYAFPVGLQIPRRNHFLGRWIQHGGFWPDPKLRLFRRGAATFEDRLVHEDVRLEGPTARLSNALLHHSYPTLADYLDHMNRYSSLGAEMAVAKGHGSFSVLNIVVRPLLTFIYNYFFRLGFLDGREGLLLHLYHAVYVSWKYAKAWELARQKASAS